MIDLDALNHPENAWIFGADGAPAADAATAPSAPAIDLATVRQRFDELRMKHSRLLGGYEANLRRQKELTETVALAKGRQSLAVEIAAVFEEMQHVAHARSVGSLEQVLTAVVEDNFPGKGKIKLDLGTERGAPALDLKLDVGGGILEDILYGNGGAINNVVVLGLKYCALERTKNRRLMVLDEPDIWLKEERVRNFFKVLSDVTEQLKTQTLTISHKDPAYFEGRATLIRMYSDGEQIRSTILEPRVRDWADNAEPGIRYIHAIGVGIHKDTLVHFMPGLNALVGDNDLGKSTLISKCLRAVSYGEFDEDLMHHFVDPEGDGETQIYVQESKIIVGLEDDFRIEMTRKLKGSPKIMYTLYKGEEKLFEGRPEKKNAVPEQIAEVINVRKVDDMDFQLCWQKEPIFLLNQVPSVRARLLTIGRESGHLSALIAGYRKLQVSDNETVRNGEAELTRLSWRMPILAKLVPISGTLTILNQIMKDVDDAQRSEKALYRALQTIETSKRAIAVLNAKRNALSRLPDSPPVLHDNKRLAQVAGRIKAFQQKAALVVPAINFEPPALHNNVRLLALCEKIQATSKKAALTVPEVAIEVPVLHDNKRLAQVAGRVKALQQQHERLAALPELTFAPPVLENLQGLSRKLNELDKITAREKALLAEQEALEKEYLEEEARVAALQAELGNCPLCNHPLPQGALVHAH